MEDKNENEKIVIDMLREDIREIKGDVKELLKFKSKWEWKVMGGSVTLSAIVGYLTKFLDHK